MFGNWLKTSLLLAVIVALFGTVGALLGGAQGMVVALALGGALAGLFSTHPDTGECVARLNAMARDAFAG
jgi:Zn-dependent protease with chaperone function